MQHTSQSKLIEGPGHAFSCKIQRIQETTALKKVFHQLELLAQRDLPNAASADSLNVEKFARFRVREIPFEIEHPNEGGCKIAETLPIKIGGGTSQIVC